MKTLDETIKDIETCQRYPNCIGCPYHGFTDCTSKWGNDALYYLKEYKEIMPDYVALKEYWSHEQENPQLTWEELKQMIGKPVYEFEFAYGDGGRWVVIQDFKVIPNNFLEIKDSFEEFMLYTDGSRLSKRYLNECFSVFRKEVPYK